MGGNMKRPRNVLFVCAVFFAAFFAIETQARASIDINLSPAEFARTEACDSTKTTTCPSSSAGATVLYTGVLSARIDRVAVSDTIDFQVSTDNCTGRVLTVFSSSCGLSLLFHPASAGHHEATLKVDYTTISGSGSTSVTLKGDGYAPSLSIYPVTVDFGKKAVGSEKEWMEVSVANNSTVDVTVSEISMLLGSDPAFGVDGTCVKTFSPSEICLMGVSFEPTDAGQVGEILEAFVSVREEYAQDQQIELLGTVVAADKRDVSISKSAILFGNQTVGTRSSVQTFIIKNVGTPDVEIDSIDSDSADFEVTDDCGTKPATLRHLESCTVSQTFYPSTAGLQGATVTITDNAPDAGSTQTVTLAGLGIDPTKPAVDLSPTTLNFGNQTVGTSSAKLYVLLVNKGGAALNVTSVTVDGPFTIDTDCDDNEVAPDGGRCGIVIAFAPTATGSVTGTITINDNAPDTPQAVSLKGTGTAAATPVASLSATSINFGQQNIDTSATQVLIVTNTGTSDLSIELTELAGEGVEAYSMKDGCYQTVVDPDKSCQIIFTFYPTTTASYAATFSMDDDAAGSPQSVVIAGTGITSSSSGCSVLYSDKTQLWGALVFIMTIALLAGIRSARTEAKLRRR